MEEPEVCEHFTKDCEIVAKQGYAGAYTLMACVTHKFDEQFQYFKLAAEGGSPKGMTALGFVYGMMDDYENAFKWLLKGAQHGERHGQLLVALSYEFGMYTPLDYDKAFYWYHRALKENRDGYAANNIGAMLMRAGYYQTALRFFRIARRRLRRYDYRENTNRMADMIKLNAHRCRQVMRAPKEQQPFYFVLQQYETCVESIFRVYKDKQSEPAHGFDHRAQKPPVWQPATDCPDIQRELFQRKLRTLPQRISSIFSGNRQRAVAVQKPKRKIDQFESIELRQNRQPFVPNQHELIFLEKKIHGALNHYLMENCLRLDARFRSKGFFLTYLPEVLRRNSQRDIIGYLADDIASSFKYISEPKKRDTIAQFWDNTIETYLLPPDCAGFLHYNHKRTLQTDEIYFDFIMIPFEPDVDFDYLFEHFVQYLDKVPLVSCTPSAFNEDAPADLPLRTTLIIREDYSIVLKEHSKYYDKPIYKELNMPVLAKVFYITLINHPEGIVLKQLPDYRDELMKLYSAMSTRTTKLESIDRLIDATSNSANEQISRIRKALHNSCNYQAQYFAPNGIPGERYSVNVPKNYIENHLIDK